MVNTKIASIILVVVAVVIVFVIFAAKIMGVTVPLVASIGTVISSVRATLSRVPFYDVALLNAFALQPKSLIIDHVVVAPLGQQCDPDAKMIEFLDLLSRSSERCWQIYLEGYENTLYGAGVRNPGICFIINYDFSACALPGTPFSNEFRITEDLVKNYFTLVNMTSVDENKQTLFEYMRLSYVFSDSAENCGNQDTAVCLIEKHKRNELSDVIGLGGGNQGINGFEFFGTEIGDGIWKGKVYIEYADKISGGGGFSDVLGATECEGGGRVNRDSIYICNVPGEETES